MSSPVTLVTANISRCRPSRMEKHKRQDDLPLNMSLFFLVGYGGAQLESLALMDEKGGASAGGGRGVACGTQGFLWRLLSDSSEHCAFVGGKEVREGTLGCLLRGALW